MFKKTRKSKLLKEAAVIMLCAAVMLVGTLGSSLALAEKRFEGVEITVFT